MSFNYNGLMMIKKIDIDELWDKAQSDPNHDLELDYAKENFYQRNEDEIFSAFNRSVIERQSELESLPPSLFIFYFPFFNRFILAGKHLNEDLDDIVSCYLTLVDNKLDSGELDLNLVDDTEKAVNYLYINIHKYNRSPEIYGDLREKAALIKSKLVLYESKVK